MTGITVRRALARDARSMAELHARRIDEGFLPTLGTAFLARLYGRVVRTRTAAAFVAVDAEGTTVGFAAACADLGSLYRRFAVRDGAIAALQAAPRIARSWRRVLETMRYPQHADGLPPAEILAVAVGERAAGRGVGRALVDACVRDLARSGVTGVKVTAGSHNGAARALYEGCGFHEATRVHVHDGVESSVYVRDCVARGPAPLLHSVELGR